MVETYLVTALEMHLVPMRRWETFDIRMPKLWRHFKSPRRPIILGILKQFSLMLYVRRACHIEPAGYAGKYWIRFLGFRLTWSAALLMRRVSTLRPLSRISQLGLPQAPFDNTLVIWGASTGGSTWSSAHHSASYPISKQLRALFWRSRTENLTSLFFEF